MPRTNEQLSVIEHEGWHALISAVAGSGKTTTMIGRIGFLLDAGVEANRILCLLFNKSARDDFENRLKRAYPGRAVPEVFTYHAFGLRLTKALERAGRLPEAVLETSPAKLIRLARTALQLANESLDETDAFDTGYESAQEFLEAVDMLKNALYDGVNPPIEMPTLEKKTQIAFERFEAVRQELGVKTYADLVVAPVQLALNNTAVANFIGNRYDHILIDEFQDISEAQMKLVTLLAGTRAKVMAVGDDDQTIYVWRGARPDYMTHRFGEVFVGAKHYTLSKTFRYGSVLSTLANNVITNNKTRLQKTCVSALPIDTTVNLQMYTDGYGKHVAEELCSWKKTGKSLRESAILVREYANTIPVEIALQKERIPYRLEGAPSFVHRPEAMVIRAYLRLCHEGGLWGVTDPQLLKQMVNALLSIPSLYLLREEIDVITSAVLKEPQHFVAICSRFFKKFSTGKKAFAADRRFDAIAIWASCLERGTSASAARFLADTFTRANLFTAIRKQNSRKEIAEEKVKLLHGMLRLAESGRHTIQSFSEYLQSIADNHSSVDENQDSTLITSIHRSKGLEWPLVVLPDLAEGLFPLPAQEGDEDNIEDERRLFYVAATRAMNKLLMLSPLDPELVKVARAELRKMPPVDKMKASRFVFEARLQA